MRVRMSAVPLLLLAASLLAACPSGVAPQLLTIDEKQVGVNTRLEFDVAATDGDSETLTFTMTGAPPGATLSEIGGKLAKFNWTPKPSEVRLWSITFVVSDGVNEDTETVNIRVQAAGSPVWITESTRFIVNPQSEQTVKFQLDVRDDDSAEVFFEYDPDPKEWGAELAESPKRVVFSWTPNEEQLKQAQWIFRVIAVDPEGNQSDKVVTIVFRGATDDRCPPDKQNPEISADDPGPQLGDDDYFVQATITDADSDVQYASVLYSLVPEPQDGDWKNANLEQATGDIWAGTIPNAQLQPGESVTITWQVCAADNDDPNGDRCDGWLCTEPKTFVATKGLALCDACVLGQCAGGECISNARDEQFCATDCGPGDTCPSGFACINVPLDAGPRKLCSPAGCRNGASDPLCSCTAGRVFPPVPGDLVINEVLYDPPLACPDGQSTCDATAKLTVDVNGDGTRIKDEDHEEFVEFLNVSTKVLDLNGVELRDGGATNPVKMKFGAVTLAPGKAVVVFGGGDPTKFPGFGGAQVFVSKASVGGRNLELANGGDSVKLVLAGTVIDEISWASGTVKDQSIVRQVEGQRTATLVAHSGVNGSSGSKWSIGTHVCGAPFPLDLGACAAPTCTVSNTNKDVEPGSNARGTAPCLKPLPQSVTSTVAVNQTDASKNDLRDLYAIDGVAGQWLHAYTSAGAAPDVGDTIVRLLSRGGLELARNDDDPWNPASFYSRVITQLPSTGVYFLEVVPFAVGTQAVSGSYRLDVALSATEPAKP